MTVAIRIALICAAAALICVAIRVNRPDVAAATALAAGLAVCVMSLAELGDVVKTLKRLTEDARIADDDLEIVLRACGIALVGEYASQLCRDAGEGALAQRVEFGVRVSVLALVSPVALEVMETVSRLAGA